MNYFMISRERRKTCGHDLQVRFFPIGVLTYYRSDTLHYRYNYCRFRIKEHYHFFHNGSVMILLIRAV